MLEMEGKVALITGAAQGIGEAIARRFLERGAKVAMGDINAEAVRLTAERFIDEQDVAEESVSHASVDVTDSSSIREWIRGIVERWGRIDILVNNAGIQLNRSSLELSDDDWRKVMGVDLDGVFYCSREAGKEMVRQRKGCIINISSIAERFGLARRLPYGVAKAGVSSLTRVLAVEWAGEGVRVNAIAPGYVETELVTYAFAQGHIDKQDILSKIPANCLASPEQIADTAIFLASDKASYITGQVIFVDGGYSVTK